MRPHSHRLGDLSSEAFAGRFCDPGIYVRTGPFLVHVRSSLSPTAETFQFLYEDYSLEERGIADFHISVEPPLTLRRWVHKQAVFFLDGQSPFHPFPQRLATPLLEWGLNWCVSTRAHQYLILHSAVVERGGRALILPGPPGSGKSTLCAALIHRGWRLLSDEHALFRLTDGAVVPFPRPVALKDASIDLIREFSRDAVLGPAYTDTRKGILTHMRPPASSVERVGETAKPAWIVFPNYQRGTSVQADPLPKAHAFLRLADNSFNYHILGAQGFNVLADVIDSSSCYELLHGGLDDATNALNDLTALP